MNINKDLNLLYKLIGAYMVMFIICFVLRIKIAIYLMPIMALCLLGFLVWITFKLIKGNTPKLEKNEKIKIKIDLDKINQG